MQILFIFIKKLLSFRFSLMGAKILKYLLCYGQALKNWDFKVAENQHCDCSLGVTTFEASEFLKTRPRSGSPYVIIQEAIKKDFENAPHQKMIRMAQMKKISVATASRIGKKMGGKVWDYSWKTGASAKKHPFVERPKESPESHYHFLQ